MDGGGFYTSRCPFKKKTCFLIIKAICFLRHYGPEMCYYVLVSGMFWCSRGSRGLDRIPREGLMCYLSSYICKNRTALEDKQYKACLAVCLCVLRTCWCVSLQVLESNHMFSEAHPPHIKWPHTELCLLLSPLIHTSLTGCLPVLKSLIIGCNWALITLSWGIIWRNKREKDTQSQHIGMRLSSNKICKRIKVVCWTFCVLNTHNTFIFRNI